MNAMVEKLMELGQNYGWAVSDYEDRRTQETHTAMEVAEQAFRSALVAAMPVPPLAPKISTTGILVGQVLTMAALMERALEVLRNVEAEGCHDEEDLQDLISQHEASIAAVLNRSHQPEVSHGR